MPTLHFSIYARARHFQVGFLVNTEILAEDSTAPPCAGGAARKDDVSPSIRYGYLGYNDATVVPKLTTASHRRHRHTAAAASLMSQVLPWSLTII